MTHANEDLTFFINGIMNINATLPAMGGAEAAILGTTHPSMPIVMQVKRTAVQFAEAYRKDPQADTTKQLAQEVEGLLSVLQATSVISEEVYDELVDMLKKLESLMRTRGEAR